MVARWHTPSEQLNPPGLPRDDFAAVNIGQLKAVAKPFYDRLIVVGYASTYPWTAPDAELLSSYPLFRKFEENDGEVIIPAEEIEIQRKRHA